MVLARTLKKAALVAVALFLLGVGPAWADRALVIGVNQYPHQPPNRQLQGCVNDARAMADLLKKRGFQVEVLLDGNATHSAILQALTRLASTLAAGDRLVVYFSGHGSRLGDGTPVLVTFDTRRDGQNAITADQLYGAVKSVPASARTVILDCCISGAMSRGVHGALTDVRSRYCPLEDTPRSRAVNDQSEAGFMARGGGQAFYVTAARGTEESLECAIQGTPRGVFTYFLVPRLDGRASRWAEVLDPLSAEVPEFTQDRQHPTFTRGMEEVLVFSGQGAPASTPAPAPPPPRPGNSLWEQFNSDRVDSSRLTLRMEPDRTPLRIGESVRFRARVQEAGWLVLLERGTSGRINLLFPLSGNLQDARVAAGSEIAIPPGEDVFIPDQGGTERLKAILFRSSADAGRLLDALRVRRGESFDALARDLQLKPSSHEGSYNTADLMFEVTPGP